MTYAQSFAEQRGLLAIERLLSFLGHLLLLLGGFAQLALNARDLLVLASQYGLLATVALLQLADLDQAFALHCLELTHLLLLLLLVLAEGVRVALHLLDELDALLLDVHYLLAQALAVALVLLAKLGDARRLLLFALELEHLALEELEALALLVDELARGRVDADRLEQVGLLGLERLDLAPHLLGVDARRRAGADSRCATDAARARRGQLVVLHHLLEEHLLAQQLRVVLGQLVLHLRLAQRVVLVGRLGERAGGRRFAQQLTVALGVLHQVALLLVLELLELAEFHAHLADERSHALLDALSRLLVGHIDARRRVEARQNTNKQHTQNINTKLDCSQY